MHEWDHFQFFEFNFWCGSVQALLRYRSKCKNSPLTPIVTKISFALFSTRRGPPTPKLPRSRPCCLLYPEPKFHADRTILRWDILNRTNKQTNKHRCVSKTDTNPPFAFQIAFLRGTDFTGFLQGGSNRPVTFESNRIWTSDSNSNRIWKFCRSLSKSYTRCLWACIFSGHWDIGDWRLEMVRNSIFFRTFGPSFGNPWPKWMALCQNVRRSLPYICDCTWRCWGKQKR